MKCRFDLVVVIGCGKIAEDVLLYVNLKKKDYHYDVQFIEHEHREFSRLKGITEEKKIEYAQIPDKQEMTQFLLKNHKRTLIISAGNYYIFPKSVVEQNNLEIINFHNALLPKLPGRNAPTWAIYLKEAFTGPTWHYVTAGIDAGAIIAQKHTPVLENIKAYELTQTIMTLAFDLFQDFYESLLTEHIDGTPQAKSTLPRKIYYSYELPHEGMCSFDTPASEIYCLLRAVDYGKNAIFPPIKLVLPDTKVVEIRRYKKQLLTFCDCRQKLFWDKSKQCIYFFLDEAYELKVNYKSE